MTIARWTPRFVPPRPAAWRPVQEGGEREALIIGGGLAGCAAAWGLHLQGWHSTVLDRQPDPAMETSGNPGGLMHGIFNVADGPHARWFRAAALHTARWAQPAVTRGDVAGALDGLLRLDEALDSTAGLHDAVAQFKAVLDEPGYLTALDLAATRDASKLALPHAAWRFGAAGWLAPRAWSRWLLEASGARWQGNTQVAQVRRVGSHWQALDGAGRLLAQAPVLVLAHGLGARELWPEGTPALPLQAIRGQTTIVPATVSGLVRPTLPVSGGGYALTLPNGDVLIGATQQHHDDERALREADQQHNIRRAAALGVLPPTAMLPLQGRVGWRATVQGRLPVIGAPVDEALVQAAEAAGQRLHALHHLPRLHDADGGLYVFTALGSRGITSAALGARLLASWISGAPCPVEASLRDALDPARRLSPR